MIVAKYEHGTGYSNQLMNGDLASHVRHVFAHKAHIFVTNVFAAKLRVCANLLREECNQRSSAAPEYRTKRTQHGLSDRRLSSSDSASRLFAKAASTPGEYAWRKL